jgi:hypothetical protein
MFNEEAIIWQEALPREAHEQEGEIKDTLILLKEEILISRVLWLKASI